MAMLFTSDKPKNAATAEDLVIEQLDELERVSAARRKELLGDNWYSTVRDFYNLKDPAGRRPSFRPVVHVPELQVLMLNEATDLSDATPRVYIASGEERDQKREEAFQRWWETSGINNRILYGSVWSQFSGLGVLQVGVTPEAILARDRVWVEPIDPEYCLPDPQAKNIQQDAAWFSSKMFMHQDAIELYWPSQGHRVRPGMRKLEGPESGRQGPKKLELPDGPMKGNSEFGQEIAIGGDRLPVRFNYIRDFTRERISDEAGTKSKGKMLVEGKNWKLKYPRGRLIIDCQGVVLFDDANPTPNGWFPYVRILSMPDLYGFWPVPPIRYSRSLQDLAGRMLSQVFENAVRLNNGVWFINENTGIQREKFGGLPGEVQIINASATSIPEIRTPPEFPQHFLTYPQYLLDLQRQLQGFTPARAGQAQAGNISENLFEDTLFQSQHLTRLRSRLLAESVQSLAEIVFYSMLAFMPDNFSFPDFSSTEIRQAIWQGVKPEEASKYTIQLDPASVRPMSSIAMKNLTMALRDRGMVDARSALKALNYPDADGIATAIENEQRLAALSHMQRRQR